MEKLIFRTVEVFREEKWERVDFTELSAGEKFRMFVNDGTILEDSEGNSEFTATDNPKPCELKGNYSVLIVDV